MLLFVELMGVTTSQLSPFCKVVNTLTELKKAYVMYCPKTFTYNDAVGKEDEEEVEPEVDEDSGEQTKSVYVAAKIKEFADEPADDVDADNNDKSNIENDKDDDGGVDAILPIDAESTSVTSRNNKLDSVLDTSKKLWQAIADLVECKDMHEIFDLTLCASARIQSIEPSSSSYGRKYNSFLGRWFGTGPLNRGEESDNHAQTSDLMIECNRLIMCQIKTGTDTSTTQIPAKYCVIGAYKKSYNKWFMAKEHKKPWISLSRQDRKKYKIAIRMVENLDAESLILNDCQDVSVHDARLKQSDICNIVHGDEIFDVLPFLHKYK